MNRLKRHRDFEIKLSISNDGFISPPRDSQRQWLVNRAMTEFSWDLEALDQLSHKFVAGREELIYGSRNDYSPAEDDIMELWQMPIMEKMVHLLTTAPGDILEIGYGRGVSARMIQRQPVKSHTIVECVPAISQHCQQWIKRENLRNISVIEGRWEDVYHQFSHYDGIFFHTYPMDSDEYAQMVRNRATLAEPFFPVAAKHLNPGGTFTYFTNEMDSLSRSHQRALLEHFSQFSVQTVKELPLPENVKDTWWLDQMIVIAAQV